MNSLVIRNVCLDDVEAILKIYSPYIETSATSFEEKIPSINSFSKRVKDISSKFPYIIAKYDGVTVGYAYATALRSRSAYRWSVETTVYVSKNHHRKGVGRELYKNLFEILRKQNFKNAFAAISLPNQGSRNLHMRMGFEKIGVYKNVGFKLDQWWDVEWWQLEL